MCVCARARNVCRVDRFLTPGKFMEHKFCATIIGTHETSVSEAITRKLVVCNKNRIQNKVYFVEEPVHFKLQDPIACLLLSHFSGAGYLPRISVTETRENVVTMVTSSWVEPKEIERNVGRYL